MESIVGTELIKGETTASTADLLAAPLFIGIYFGAHWAPPCRRFTSTLKTIYEEINKDGVRFEVIFCSSDGDDKAFKRNFAEMPWAAVDYADDVRKATLSQKFGIMAVPTLIILDKEGHIISYDGRQDLQQHQAGVLEPWEKIKSQMQV